MRENLESPEEYIQNQIELLIQERDKERQEYEESSKSTSLKMKVQKGLAWYPISIESEDYPLKGRILLSIQKNPSQTKNAISSGSPVVLFSTNESQAENKIYGTVSKLKENQMDVLFRLEELPDWVESDEIAIEIFYDETSYDEMERALKILLKPEKKYTQRLRDVLTGFSEPRFGSESLVKKMPELNESQNQTLENFLNAEDFALLHGPPGTGKTYTLVHAVKKILEKESRVLLTASSNVAVDLLTEKCLELGLKAVRIGNPARVSEKILEHSLDYLIENHEDYKNIKKYKKEAQVLFKKAGKFKRNFGKEERETRMAQKKEARDLMKVARDQQNLIITEILEKADVITCTLVGITFTHLQNLEFETIMVDEATQSLEPAIWIAVLKTKRRIFFAGDHKQLPPTTHTQGELNITLFEKLIKKYPSFPVNSLLNIQYRMKPQILGFSNENFYENKLQTDESVLKRKFPIHLEDLSANKHFTFIDTAGKDYWELWNEQTESFSNPGEADLLTEIVKSIFEHKPEKKITVGILSPYREQVRTLQEKFKSLEIGENWDWEINTVDSFQGSERDIIIISLVRSNDLADIGFLSDYRRFNVAITRAKEELIVIGDSGTLSNNSFYSRFLEYSSQYGSYRTAWEFE